METTETNNVMLIYAYDTQNDGTELGPGSKERLDAGIKYILKSEWSDWIVLLGAGWDPKRPGNIALKYRMEFYIEEKLRSNSFSMTAPIITGSKLWKNDKKRISTITSYSNAWGTPGETLEALRTLFKRYKGRVGYYYAVSSDFHLPRIKLLWWILGLPVKTIGTPWKPLWKEQVLEPVKMVKVILKGILHHLKGGF